MCCVISLLQRFIVAFVGVGVAPVLVVRFAVIVADVVVVVVVVGFFLSHVLGPMLGSYRALILVATTCSVVVYLLTCRKGSTQRLR